MIIRSEHAEQDWEKYIKSQTPTEKSKEEILKDEQAIAIFHAQEKKRIEKSIKIGLYRPRDAALIISNIGGGDEEEILEKLDAALNAKELHMFKRGHMQDDVNHSFEIPWRELNEWIKGAYPNIEFEFQTPKIPPKLTKDYKQPSKSSLKLLGTAEAEALGGVADTSPPLASLPQPQANVIECKEKENTDTENVISQLFDPVPVEALEKMFPANNQWKKWAEKAKATGLIQAKDGRARFNPYKAGVWFVKKGQEGWDTAKLNRVLANNLPARSKDSAHYFIN